MNSKYPVYDGGGFASSGQLSLGASSMHAEEGDASRYASERFPIPPSAATTHVEADAKKQRGAGRMGAPGNPQKVLCTLYMTPEQPVFEGGR